MAVWSTLTANVASWIQNTIVATFLLGEDGLTELLCEDSAPILLTGESNDWNTQLTNAAPWQQVAGGVDTWSKEGANTTTWSN